MKTNKLKIIVTKKGKKTIKVKWAKYTGHAQKIVVYRDSMSTEMGSVPITQNSLKMPVIPDGRPHTYWVMAHYGNVSSAPSNCVVVMTKRPEQHNCCK